MGSLVKLVQFEFFQYKHAGTLLMYSIDACSLYYNIIIKNEKPRAKGARAAVGYYGYDAAAAGTYRLSCPVISLCTV